MSTRATVRSSGGLTRAAARLRAMAGEGPARTASAQVAQHMTGRVRGAWAQHTRTGAAAASVRAEVSHREVRIHEAAYRPFVKGLAHQLRLPEQWRAEIRGIVSVAWRRAR